jgi:hypothetical protein
MTIVAPAEASGLTLADGRRVERVPRRCGATGDTHFHYHVRDDAGTRRHGHTSSPGERFREFHSQNSNATDIDPRPADPIRDELDKLAAEGFPLVAEMLAKKVPPRVDPFPGALFRPGPIGFGAAIIATGLSRADVLEYVRRHVAGDHGEFGSSAGIEPSAEEMFCPVEASQAVKNAVAIKTGRGLVVSRYPLWEPGVSDQAAGKWAKDHHPSEGFPLRRDDRLTVVTLLAGPKTATATCESRRGAQIPS